MLGLHPRPPRRLAAEEFPAVKVEYGIRSPLSRVRSLIYVLLPFCISFLENFHVFCTFKEISVDVNVKWQFGQSLGHTSPPATAPLEPRASLWSNLSFFSVWLLGFES